MDYSGAGSIKKIFGRQREPYGFVTIHQPQEVKGMEAVFYLKVNASLYYYIYMEGAKDFTKPI